MRRWGSLLLALALGCGRLGYDGDAGADAAAERPLECHGFEACELSCPTESGCRFRCVGSTRCQATCTTDCVLDCSGSAECVLLCQVGEQRCTGPGCTLSCGG